MYDQQNDRNSNQNARIVRKKRQQPKYALPSIIKDDLLRYWKLPLCLFTYVILTAVLVVTTTYDTRLLTAEHEQLVLEHDALDIEWRNLILEKNSLGDLSLVERIAKDMLEMEHIDPSKENIVVRNH